MTCHVFAVVIWAYALQCASVLAGAQMKTVSREARSIPVDDLRWRAEVVRDVQCLIRTLQLLSTTFGRPLGHWALSSLLLALALIGTAIETEGVVALIFAGAVVVSMTNIARCAARTSTWCEELRFMINDKRTEELGEMTPAKALELDEMETALRFQNAGQGYVNFQM